MLVTLTNSVQHLDEGLMAARFDGRDLLEDLIAKGGAGTLEEAADFLIKAVLQLRQAAMGGDAAPPAADDADDGFGCSVFQVPGSNGYFFGRNFDWHTSDAMILETHPKGAFASITNIDLEFIQKTIIMNLPDDMLVGVATLVPMDGMNEKGLCVSINRISDPEGSVAQSRGNPKLLVTMFVRLLLNRASTTQEALELMDEYDFQSAFIPSIHFAIADASGDMVDVEYIDNEMSVIRTPILTNHYLTPGKKFGIGTDESHTRFETLQERYSQREVFTSDDARDMLDSVAKHNFETHMTTEWSAVFDQTAKMVRYFHREDYSRSWEFSLASN